MKNSSVVVVLSILVLGLSVALIVSAFSGRARRHNIRSTATEICAKHNDGLDVMHDLIVIASAPPKGKTLTPAQVQATVSFQTKAFARINAARC